MMLEQADVLNYWMEIPVRRRKYRNRYKLLEKASWFYVLKFDC